MFSDFLQESSADKYSALGDVVNFAPDGLKPTLNKVLKSIEPYSMIKVENKNAFKAFNGRKNSATILKTSYDNVQRLAKAFNVSIINVDKNHKGFYYLTDKSKDKPYYMIKIVETGDLSLEGRGSRNTIYQEVGVLLYLDNDLKHIDSHYRPSPMLYVGKDEDESQTNIEQTIAFLARRSDWSSVCLNTARQIARKFPNYKQYELHRGSVLFNMIKNRGLKLTGLTHTSSDKWNPSDVFLIKNGHTTLNKINQFSNIVQINQYFTEFDDIIGISLKKGDKEAMHGAVSLDNVVAMKSLGQPLLVVDNFEKNKASVYTNLKKLHNSALASMLELTKCTTKDLLQAVNQINPKSQNFGKSLPPAVEFLTRICNNVQHANDVITLAYLTAVSKHPLSCPHYKADGTKIVLIDHDQQTPIELTKILIPMNGDTNVIFVLDVDGKNTKLQLRSKGSKPQFIVLKNAVTTTGTPLTAFSL